jgi:hypothetical protein
VVELERPRHPRGPRPRRGGRAREAIEPLEPGQKVRDRFLRREGEIVDLARQYSHPKADPVFNYLIRWEDGQVQAFSQEAFGGPGGLDTID